MAQRLHNSFAYRFSRFAKSVQAPFIISLNGKNLNVPLIGTLGEYNIRLSDNWFARLFKALNLPPDSDFLDIGANEGQTLLTFRSLYDNPYWGFEPNPICNYYLEELVSANEFKRVNILPIGLSSQQTLARFYSKHSHDSGATIVDDFRPGYYEPGEVKYVPVFSLDNLELRVKKISLIKIDVEGAEVDVIAGMLETIRQHQPMIVCEVLDYHAEETAAHLQERASQLMEYLRQLNYKAYRILHSGTALQYEPVADITLIQWTEASFELNDYLFIPQHASLPK